MAKNYTDLAIAIVKNVGGENNVDMVWHCATRLRFKLKDKSKANKSTIEELEGVVTVVESGGQFQIVIGNAVSDVYEKVGELTNIKVDSTSGDSSNPSKEKTNILDTAIDTISAIFQPMLTVLCGSGILKGILMLCTSFGVLSEISGTYTILYAAADSVFYFLPLILAYTSAKKFKTNPFIAAAIAGALIYPSIQTAMSEGTAIRFLGIPVVLMSYTSTVIPIIISVYVLSKVERFLNKILPDAIKNFITPTLCLAVITPLTFLVIGPIGTYVGDILAAVFSAIYNFNPILSGAVIGGVWQIFVIFGIHWSFIPIITNNIAIFGRDTFSAMNGPSNFSQAGASLGVFLKTKDKSVKTIAGSAAITGVFGITEPSIYGVTLKYKRPFVIAAIAGAIGGAIAGACKSSVGGFVICGLLSLPAFAGDGFGGFLIACVVSYLSAAIGTYLFGYSDDMIANAKEKLEENKSNNEIKAEVKSKSILTDKDIQLSSPLSGEIVPLSEVADEAFASGALGKGAAIIPGNGRLYAPADVTVVAAFPTGHALGLATEDGVEILIHIGFDTVNLNGKYFNVKVKSGQKVKKGELLVEFDIEKIKNEGFDITTPIIITNSDQYSKVEVINNSSTKYTDEFITVIR